MQVSIKYCVMWNYTPQATSLAATIKKSLGIDAELIEGSGGVFDVRADGKLIFSKDETGRFPTADEILESLRA